MMKREKYFICLLLSIFLSSLRIYCEERNENEDSEALEQENVEIVYITPQMPPSAYLFEPFDELNFEKKWIKSRAKKYDVDESIAKYDGIWAVEEAIKDPLTNDRGLILKSSAKHAAISVSLLRPYIFKDKPFVAQYEVNFQNGQECGGAYIKLLSKTERGSNLENFNDKTPYTIMFGPDKCGNDHKFHFIFRHVNPLTKEIKEKHCKKPKGKMEEYFKDERPHLYTLILLPDNTYKILIDHQVVNSGHLLEDFTPTVNPPREIDDPNDSKPSDWDEREKIPDPHATKPLDWDENAPQQIMDQFAIKPDDWLEDESELIPDPEAVKPADWDDEMDGEWEAPRIPNPKCERAVGCGPWSAPMVDNPNYKGKWKAPMIDNPNYKGKWTPRKIANPYFFEDLEPFKMTSIGALGLELWSMSHNIYFDNFLITDDIDEAQQVAADTFDLKLAKLDKGQKGIISQVIEFSNKHPWIYGVYVLVLAIPVVLIFLCCCAEDVKDDKESMRKKTDAPTADDAIKDGEENAEGMSGTKKTQKDVSEYKDDVAEEKEYEKVEALSSESEAENTKGEMRASPRLRKVRKD